MAVRQAPRRRLVGRERRHVERPQQVIAGRLPLQVVEGLLVAAARLLEGQRRGVTIAPVNDLDAVLADPQLAAHDFWQDFEIDDELVRAPGPPFRLTAGGGGHARRAPRLGEHTDEILAELGHLD